MPKLPKFGVGTIPLTRLLLRSAWDVKATTKTKYTVTLFYSKKISLGDSVYATPPPQEIVFTKKDKY